MAKKSNNETVVNSTAPVIKRRGRPKKNEMAEMSHAITETVEELKNHITAEATVTVTESPEDTVVEQEVPHESMETAFLNTISKAKKVEIKYRGNVIFYSPVHYNIPIVTDDYGIEVFNNKYPYAGLEIRVLE